MASNLLKRFSQAIQGHKTESSSPSGSSVQSDGKHIRIGTLINARFRLEAEIGRGGMGIVYLARDVPNQRDAAVKVLNLEQTNALSLGQFSREAQIIARLNHPHIVSVYEIGTVQSGDSHPAPYIAMEYVRGSSLDSLHNLTFPRIVDLGQQICAALEYAHNQGFIHRDLKPGNVLIEKQGFKYFAKLVDFGLAMPRGLSNLPPGNNLAGTVFYLAPEVIAGQPADVASDLYALGAMLYEMVTGRVPFSDFFDDQAILTQHLEETASPPSHSRAGVPPALEAIILRLLAKDPQERFQTAQDVCQALAQVGFDSPQGRPLTNLPPLPSNPGLDENQMDECIRLLEAHPLLTLIGADSQPALALGARLMNEFAEGIWLVELELVEDPAGVLPTVTHSLAIAENPQRAPAVTLIEYLREKNILLILNHCDRLLNACSQLTATILENCPDVSILATSRAPLNVRGEVCYRSFTTH